MDKQVIMDIRSEIKQTMVSTRPFDDLEEIHINDAVNWIDSGAEIFRIEKPDNPPKHLVVFCVLFDKSTQKILLLEHSEARLLLTPGGHVDKDEHPYDAAMRELYEEVNLEGIEPINIFGEKSPLFISIIETVGKYAGHIDVDLWYVFEGDSTVAIDETANDFQKEFDGYDWYTFEEILNLSVGPTNQETDMHIHRFVKKLQEIF